MANQILAFIPARSGSKGLMNKNIRPLNGLPLMAHTILCAKQSGLFSEIHVSTDSQQYADIATEYGADVPFLRPEEFATNSASSLDTLKCVLETYAQMGKHFEISVLLQPTSPQRLPEDITTAYELFCKKSADSVVAVCETEHSPFWCNILPEDRSLFNFIPEETRNKPRQLLNQYYRINGAIYIIRNDYFKQSAELYGKNSYAYIMPKERSVDIDDEMDFIIAQALMKQKK